MSMMNKVDAKSLATYLNNNISVENSYISADGTATIRLDGIEFRLYYNRVSYTKYSARDTISIDDTDADNLLDKIASLYTKEELNNELFKMIREDKINKIIE